MMIALTTALRRLKWSSPAHGEHEPGPYWPPGCATASASGMEARRLGDPHACGTPTHSTWNCASSARE